MKIELSRSDVCRLMTACTTIKFSFIDEMYDERISKERKASAENSAKMWGRIRDELMKQVDEYDAEAKASDRKRCS